MKIKAPCNICRKVKTLEVDEKGIEAWQSGEKLIQDALPELPAEDRELLMTHTCGPCFEELFRDDEDYEDEEEEE